MCSLIAAKGQAVLRGHQNPNGGLGRTLPFEILRRMTWLNGFLAFAATRLGDKIAPSADDPDVTYRCCARASAA
jgi:hypothetical protein